MTSSSPPVWEPCSERVAEANLSRYLEWLRQSKQLEFSSYNALWSWSAHDIETFWGETWEFFKIKSSRPYTQILSRRQMPGANWFNGSLLNFAEHVFRNFLADKTAIVFGREDGLRVQMNWRQIREETAKVAAYLKSIGIRAGDRVAAYVPNMPQAVIAFLASASLGAVWSCCSPDFGSKSTVDRFKQIEPKVMFAVDGYQYNGREYVRNEQVREICSSLNSLQKVIIIPNLKESPLVRFDDSIVWKDLINNKETDLTFQQLAFAHPLWILYTSGTTGMPKPIVHGHGGILLEQLKALSFHFDLKPSDKFFWFTTTGWMMWNVLVSGLLLGSTIVLYDGHPNYPCPAALWKFAEDIGITFFGTGTTYITACMKDSQDSLKSYDLSRLKAIGSTGSPLSKDAFRWVYSSLDDIWLVSTSGGTDVCSAFVSGCPILPVYEGEIQCRCLGVKVECYDENGNSVLDEMGEMVITEPMPSMPVFFWGDVENKKYEESYFDFFPNVWRHGDWIEITSRGTCIIYGRSDATIKRLGVRIGTSEIYRIVDSFPEISDSLALDTQASNGVSRLILFVVVKGNQPLENPVKEKIRDIIRNELSPRHVPDEIFSAPSIPKTLNGKKLEVPIRRILKGETPNSVINLDSISNPDSLSYFVDFARLLQNNS